MLDVEPEHKMATMCLQTEKMVGDERGPRNHFDLLQWFASVNTEMVFCKDTNRILKTSVSFKVPFKNRHPIQ